MVARYIWVLLLMLGMLGQTFIRGALVLHYRWNRAAYAAYCENANRPELDCYGKCHLKKQIAIADAQGRSSQAGAIPAFFFTLKDNLLFWRPSVFWLLSQSAEPTRQDFALLTVGVSRGFSWGVFHPPCCAVFSLAR